MFVAIAALLAGIVSTVAGFGGGLLLVLALAAIMDPGQALTIAAGALLIGNAHRLYVLRQALDRRRIAALAVGIVPATILLSSFLTALPSWLLRILLVATVAIAIGARMLLRDAMTIGPRGLAAAGIGIGAFGATGGGAGLFAGPVLLVSGLRGDPYVATMAGVGVALNVSRSIGYSTAGWLDRDAAASIAVAIIAVIAGNLIGRALTHVIGERWRNRVIFAVPAVGIALSLLALLG